MGTPTVITVGVSVMIYGILAQHRHSQHIVTRLPKLNSLCVCTCIFFDPAGVITDVLEFVSPNSKDI